MTASISALHEFEAGDHLSAGNNLENAWDLSQESVPKQSEITQSLTLTESYGVKLSWQIC